MPAQTFELTSRDGLTATFVPEAGMIGISLKDGWVEILGQRRGLAAYLEDGKTMGLPILYPWANRLAGDSYGFEGVEVDLAGDPPGLRRDENGLPIHGTLAASGYWQVEEGTELCALKGDGPGGLATLKASLDFGGHPDLLRSFPFPHRLELEVKLTGRTLELTTTVTPTGETAVPLAFGFHPYLTLPGIRRGEWSVTTPAITELETDAKGLPTGRAEPAPGGTFRLGDRALDKAYAGFEDGAEFVLEAGGRMITVEFISGFPAGQIFAPVAEEVICFEPMKSPTAALSTGRELASVGPGDSDVSRFSITIESSGEEPARPTTGPSTTVSNSAATAGTAPSLEAPYRLRRGAPPGEIVAVIRGRGAHAVTLLRSPGPDGRGEAIHEARKDTKKIRAALRLARDELGSRRFREENRRYRDAARLLSGMRDAEVMAETAAALLERNPENRTELEPVLAELKGRVEWLETGVGAGDADARMRMAADEIEAGIAEIDRWKPSEAGWKSFHGGLERTYRDGRAGLAAIEEEPSSDEVHQWRKRVKDLWYQLRLLRGAWKKGLSGPVDEADRLAELLGEFSDLDVLGRGFESSRAGGIDTSLLLELVGQREKKLLERALPIGRRIYAEEPGSFAARIGSYWEA